MGQKCNTEAGQSEAFALVERDENVSHACERLNLSLCLAQTALITYNPATRAEAVRATICSESNQ
jgi:hypothetical protein